MVAARNDNISRDGWYYFVRRQADELGNLRVRIACMHARMNFLLCVWTAVCFMPFLRCCFYHKDLVRTLVTKGREYPYSLVALSGCTLRSQFRQINHHFPRELYDKHSNLCYRLSGTESLPRDERVDIVEGLAGVLVRPAFFDVAEFWEFVKHDTLEGNSWRSDDFIISAYLEHRNITKWLVERAAVHTIHTPAATLDNLGNGRHQHVMQAAYPLRSTLGVGSQFDLEDYRSLDEHWRDLIDCEADHTSYCN